VEEGHGTTKAFVYCADKGCGGWVSACVNGVVWVHVK